MDPLLQSLINWESPALLQYQAQGIPLWSMVRYDFFWRVISQSKNFASGMSLSPRRSKLQQIGDALGAYPWKRSQRKILFLSEDSVSYLKQGLWHNRLHDDYAQLFAPHTQFLLNAYRGEIRSPRAFEPYHPMPALNLHIKLRARIKPGNVQVGHELYQYIRQSLNLNLDEQTWNDLHDMCIDVARRIPSAYHVFRSYLKRQGTQLLWVNCGHYGYYAPLIAAAKDLGITVGEMQHGFWGQGHLAYQHNPILCQNPDYRRSFPSHLCSYGDFWNQCTQVPAQMHSLGNPSMGPLQTYSGCTRSQPILLVLSQWTITQTMVDFAADLARTAQVKVCFRKHPSEELSPEQLELFERLENLELDASRPLMESVQDCDAVLGSSSTAIFEAASTQRPVFVLDGPDSRFNTPLHFGNWISNASDLIQLLQEPHKIHLHQSAEFWDPQWKLNYQNFVTQFLGPLA